MTHHKSKNSCSNSIFFKARDHSKQKHQNRSLKAFNMKEFLALTTYIFSQAYISYLNRCSNQTHITWKSKNVKKCVKFSSLSWHSLKCNKKNSLKHHQYQHRTEKPLFMRAGEGQISFFLILHLLKTLFDANRVQVAQEGASAKHW